MNIDNIKTIKHLTKDYFRYNYGLSFENDESSYIDLYNQYLISFRKSKIKNIIKILNA